MPWDTKKVGDKICVYKKTTGKTLACYSGADAEERANKYLAALHANMPVEEKENFIVAKESDIIAYKKRNA